MKAKITKGFMHLGRLLNPGDEFEGEPDVIAALVRQGYALKEEQPAPVEQEQPQHEAADPQHYEPPPPKEPERPARTAPRAAPAKKTHK